MIPFASVLQWLNHFDTSQLSAPVAALLNQCASETEDAQVDELLFQVLSTTRKNKVPLEHAEALAYCSQIKFERGDYTDAQRLLNGAIPLYTEQKDYHRLAIAKWLEGMVQWKMDEAVHAFKNWYESREIIRAFSERYTSLGMPVYKTWYGERLFEMNVSLASTFEDPYTWLDRFEPSHLSQASDRMNQILKQSLHNNPAKAEALIQELQLIGNRSTDYMEQAEIQLECGRIYNYLKKEKQAERCLQRASSLFPPNGHHHAVTLWLCGLVQWKIDGQMNRAMQNWQKSNIILGALAKDAIHKNRRDMSQWYTEKEKVTANALQLAITQNFS